MPKTTSIRVRPTIQDGYSLEGTVSPELNGGRRGRKFFRTRKVAQPFADDLRVRKENFGTRLVQMPERLRHEALD